MSAWHRSGAAVLLAVLCVTTGCAATQQQQQQQSSTVSITTGDEVFDLITRAVQAELRPLVRKLESRIDAVDEKLESRIESIDGRLSLFGSQVDEITVRLFEDSQSLQLAEMSSILDSQQSQLDELVAKLDKLLDEVTSKTNSQKSQLDGLDIKVNGQKAQLDGIAAKVDNHMSRLESLTGRLASQESQVAGLVTDLDRQQTQLALLNNTSNIEKPHLDGAANETASQQTQIAELAVRLDQLEHIARPRDCSELPAGANTGIYLLRPGPGRSQSIVEAYCDMDTDGGRWTVFQRRDDIKPRQDFYLGWADYKQGFGNLTGEFWWGLNYLWQMTSVRDRYCELRVDLEDFDGNTAHAVYQSFQISSEEHGYKLSTSNYRGDAGDSLWYSDNQQFSTPDRDQDDWPGGSCAEDQQGAWWFWDCGRSNLNGRYHGRNGDDWTGIYWWHWKRTRHLLKKTEMKIRPT